jgi:hypothetical protein
MTDDALAVFLSTMHFPSSEDKEKRGQLADYYRSLKLLSKLDLADDPQEDQMQYLRPSECESACNFDPLDGRIGVQF